MQRYPGLKPFERNQRAVFYGRRDDAQRLTNLLVRERLTVMFAKSGIGKTSLLQAGVAPELEQLGFTPIFLRGDQTDIPLSDSFSAVLRASTEGTAHDSTGERPNTRQTLWELVKRLEFDCQGLPATPVLIFDQFEEIFTLGHSEASRRQFLSELGDLANETMPESIRTELLANASTLPMEVMQWWEEQPDVRLVISIRSDFLHMLDDVSPLIPGILRSRYQLRPLNREQAREAIVSPAQTTVGQYDSLPFTFSPEALQQILDFLSGRPQHNAVAVQNGSSLRPEEEIESINLQILCQYVEGKILENPQVPGFVVTPVFYGGSEGLEREIRDFYKKQIRQIPELFAKRTGRKVPNPQEVMTTAQRLIEESLVTPVGRRCSMVDDFLTSQWQVEPLFLDVLVDTRLLRREMRLGDNYYEITHDTLLPAIIESRDLRRNRERTDQEKAELAERLAEEGRRREAIEQELKAVREKRRLARKLAVTMIIALAVTVLFGIWFTWNWYRSVQKELNQLNQNVFREEFDAAVAGYDALMRQPYKTFVLQQLPPRVDLQKRLAEVLQYKSVTDSLYNIHLHIGDSLFFDEQYAGALYHYNITLELLNKYKQINDDERFAQHIDPYRLSQHETALRQRQASAFNTLRVQFDIYQRKYEAFYEARVWPLALRNLQIMEALLPRDSVHLNKLKQNLGLSESPDDYVGARKKEVREMMGSGG